MLTLPDKRTSNNSNMSYGIVSPKGNGKKNKTLLITFCIGLGLFAVFGLLYLKFSKNYYNEQKYIALEIVDNHPYLDFNINKRNLKNFVEKTNLTLVGVSQLTYGDYSKIVVNITNDIYEETQSLDKDKKVIFSFSSQPNGSILEIFISINDLSNLDERIDKDVYINKVVVNSILSEIYKQVGEERYQAFIESLKENEYDVLSTSNIYPVILLENINYVQR